MVVSANHCSPENSSVGGRQRPPDNLTKFLEDTVHISLILAKVSLLKYHPEWFDGGPIPGGPGPVFRTAITEYVVGGLVRDIAAHVTSKEVTPSLHQTAKELVAEAGRRLSVDFASSAESDDLCPPYWPHFPIPPRPHGDANPLSGGIQVAKPGPIPWLVSGPQPDPWLEAAAPAIRDIALAVALRDLATVTTVAKASAALKEAGEGIMKGAVSRAFDEYCGTPVKPRVPQPHAKPREVAVA
jgi:hypothetical protein